VPQVIARLHDRIAYGRAIRDRALCLIEAHGVHAAGLARDAASEMGLPEPQRVFWDSVAARIDRIAAAAAPARAA
jgi:hypothetical protein